MPNSKHTRRQQLAAIDAVAESEPVDDDEYGARELILKPNERIVSNRSATGIEYWTVEVFGEKGGQE